MIKENYIKELQLGTTYVQRGDRGHAVEKIQEWLTLWVFFNPAWWYKCSIDGDFGPQTESTVKKFQQFHDLEVDGVVGPQTWNKLVEPMEMAFDKFALQKYAAKKAPVDPRDLIMYAAQMHLKSVPRELHNRNEGPWVRAYMGGHDGSPWAWCVGSAQTIIDQGLSIVGMKFTDYMPHTYRCDDLGNHAKKNGLLIRNKDLRTMKFEHLKKLVKPGDILNVAKNSYQWSHTALITGVHDDHFETWEGNTNDEGSREGFEVCMRVRNFKRQNVDVIRLGIEH